MNPLDKQVGGQHYKQYGIQPIQFIQMKYMRFVEGNILKYLVRNKKRLEDLEKAYHYIELSDNLLGPQDLQDGFIQSYLEEDFFKQFKHGKLYARILAYTVFGNKAKAKELLRKFINRGEYSEV